MRHSVLWENWQIGLQTDIFRSQSCEPNSCISSYLESWVLKNWCFWTVVLDKTLESPLDCKEIQPVRPEGDQSWVLLEGLMLKLKLQYFGYLMWRADSFENTLMAGKDWGLEEKGATEDTLVGWYHWLNEHGFGWTPGVGDGQGGLACCDSWGCKESDTTEWLNWTELNISRKVLKFFMIMTALHDRKKSSANNVFDWTAAVWCWRGKWLRGDTLCPRLVVVAVRRYPKSKKRSSGCTLLEHPEEIPHVQDKRKQSKTVSTEREHQRSDRLKSQSQKLTNLITWIAPCLTQWNEAMSCRVTQDRQVLVDSWEKM